MTHALLKASLPPSNKNITMHRLENTWIDFDPYNQKCMPEQDDSVLFFHIDDVATQSDLLCAGTFSDNAFHQDCGRKFDNHKIVCWRKITPDQDDQLPRSVDSMTLFVEKAAQLAAISDTDHNVTVAFLSTVMLLASQTIKRKPSHTDSTVHIDLVTDNSNAQKPQASRLSS